MVATANLSGKSSKLHTLRRKPTEKQIEPVLGEGSIPSDYQTKQTIEISQYASNPNRVSSTASAAAFRQANELDELDSSGGLEPFLRNKYYNYE